MQLFICALTFHFVKCVAEKRPIWHCRQPSFPTITGSGSNTRLKDNRVEVRTRTHCVVQQDFQENGWIERGGGKSHHRDSAVFHHDRSMLCQPRLSEGNATAEYAVGSCKQFHSDVGCSPLPFYEPDENLRHKRKVRRSEVFHRYQPWIPQSSHHFSEI